MVILLKLSIKIYYFDINVMFDSTNSICTVGYNHFAIYI